jgi:FAD synthetase
MSSQREKEVVIAFGTFDYFHAGHEYYLAQAKALGDELIVVVSRDKTVKQIKGKLPKLSERKRASLVKKARIANKVVLGHNTDKYKVLKKYKPTVIALGYDQFAFTQRIKKIIIENNLNAKIKRIDAHFPQVFKSSIIKKSLEESSSLGFKPFNVITAKTNEQYKSSKP